MVKFMSVNVVAKLCKLFDKYSSLHWKLVSYYQNLCK